MSNETRNELGRACIGYRDAEELPQPCPTGELPTGSRHRCDGCHAENAAARSKSRQARYRRRQANAAGKGEEALAEAKAARELAEAAAAGAVDAQEVAAETLALIGTVEERLQAASSEREETHRRDVATLRDEVNNLVFRFSRLEVLLEGLARKPWWRRRRSYLRRAQLGAGVSRGNDKGQEDPR